ncbi:MAG: M15 family metallopeptidase [Acidobacteria bacterium]|nr:M15 family metallopeptidase [Acidobacteriota bacterium]
MKLLSAIVCAGLAWAQPAAPPARWTPLIGEYHRDYGIFHVYEKDGRLTIMVDRMFEYPLTELGPRRFRFPAKGMYPGAEVEFAPEGLRVGGTLFRRLPDPSAPGATFRITPLRPIDELREQARRAAPPREEGDFRTADRVELTSLDPTIHLDIRYATSNNFLGTPVYERPRASLQRPAAEALVRAHRWLKSQGYGLLIHDAYRPWMVTKIFWDATPEDKRIFVADPSKGSRHNRGCAVDLTLYDLKTGAPIEMTGGYDEMSDRSYPGFPGGTSRQRWHRELLRRAMEREGFAVFEFEWWHFDYKDWPKYPIG